jgi:hypothetical protein
VGVLDDKSESIPCRFEEPCVLERNLDVGGL